MEPGRNGPTSPRPDRGLDRTMRCRYSGGGPGLCRPPLGCGGTVLLRPPLRLSVLLCGESGRPTAGFTTMLCHGFVLYDPSGFGARGIRPPAVCTTCVPRPSFDSDFALTSRDANAGCHFNRSIHPHRRVFLTEAPVSPLGTQGRRHSRISGEDSRSDGHGWSHRLFGKHAGLIPPDSSCGDVAGGRPGSHTSRTRSNERSTDPYVRRRNPGSASVPARGLWSCPGTMASGTVGLPADPAAMVYPGRPPVGAPPDLAD